MVTQLQPDTKRVFVVSGSSAFDKRYEDVARTQFGAFEGRFEFTYWSGLPMKELLERVVDLPPDSILYPLMITQDGSGQRYLPHDQIERIATAANVPVYAWSRSTNGSRRRRRQPVSTRGVWLHRWPKWSFECSTARSPRTSLSPGSISTSAKSTGVSSSAGASARHECPLARP